MRRGIIYAVLPVALAGCTTADQNMPLVFARTQTVGVSVAGSVPDQGAHLTLGYSDRNLAIVPTTSAKGEAIRSKATDSSNLPFEDSLSVLGQFDVNAKATQVETSLGTFFSTGLAARNLAEGFRDKLAGRSGWGPPQANAAGAGPGAPGGGSPGASSAAAPPAGGSQGAGGIPK